MNIDDIKKQIAELLKQLAPKITEKITPPVLSLKGSPQYGKETPPETGSSSSCSESDSDSSDSGGEVVDKVAYKPCEEGKVSDDLPSTYPTGGGISDGTGGPASIQPDYRRIWADIMIGDYPAEYNPKVHGPYDPARYYGKPDTPFGQVKLGELGSWFARRDKHPRAAVAAISRAYWRWQHKYILPKRATVAPVLQFVTATMIFMYWINYFKIKNHYHYKYH